MSRTRAHVTPAMLRYGLSFTGPHRTALFGDGAVGAAVLLDRLGVQPRAVAFLAKVVRGGASGTRVPAMRRRPWCVRGWSPRPLEAVTELLGLRHVHRSRVAGE